MMRISTRGRDREGWGFERGGGGAEKMLRHACSNLIASYKSPLSLICVLFFSTSIVL